MSELPRLKDDDGLEGLLLRAADDDAPLPRSRAAIATALGLSPALGHGTGSVTTAAKTAAGKLGAGVVIKVTALVVAIGTGVAVNHVLPRAPRAAQIEPRSRSAIAAPPPVAPAPVIDPSRVAAPPAPSAAPLSPPHVPRATQKPRAAHATPIVEQSPPDKPVEPPVPPPTLAEEIGLIETAIGALRRDDPASALATLDRYDREFPTGTLIPEALAARIEATFAVGDTARARALAARFLADHGHSPLARRVRDLAGTAAP